MERLENAARALFALQHFRDLSADELRALESFVEHRLYRAGEEILREGETDDTVFFLVSGRAEVHRAGAKGKPEPPLPLLHDAVFGEMAFLSRAPRSAGVRAAEDCHAIALSRGDFAELCRAHPALGLSVLEKISHATSLRLRDVDQELLKALAASRRHRLVAGALLALLILGAAALHVYLAKIGVPDPAPEMTAFHASAVERVAARVPLQTFGATEVVARMTGTVRRVSFEDGKFIKEGDVLAELDDAGRAEELRAAQVAHAEARRRLDAIPGAIPPGAPERVAEEAREQEAEFAVFAARARHIQTLLLAPHDGTVSTYGAVRLAPGAAIREGDIAAVVLRPGSWGVAFCADEGDAARFPLGRTVRLRVSAASKEDFYGEVTYHAPPGEGECADVRIQLMDVPEDVSTRLALGQECEVLDSGGTQ